MKNLLLVIVVVLAVLSGVWSLFYLWGQSRPVYKYQTESIPVSKIYLDIAQISEQYPISLEYGIYIEVTLDENNILYCGPHPCERVMTLLGGQRQIDLLNQDSHLNQKSRSNSANQVSSENQLNQASQGRKLLIKVVENKINIDLAVKNFFEKLNPDEITLASDFSGVIKSLRPSFPKWSFGASINERSKFIFLGQMGLASILDSSFDIWLEQDRDKKSHLKFVHTPISEDLIVELKKRSKRIIKDCRQIELTKDLVQRLGRDAIIIEKSQALGLNLKL